MSECPRTAILKASDQIENYPDLYDFMEGSVPECGSSSCVLGWIGYFSGYKGGQDVNRIAREILGVGQGTFYDRMDHAGGSIDTKWMNENKLCARILRRYAEKYHPEGNHE